MCIIQFVKLVFNEQVFYLLNLTHIRRHFEGYAKKTLDRERAINDCFISYDVLCSMEKHYVNAILCYVSRLFTKCAAAARLTRSTTSAWQLCHDGCLYERRMDLSKIPFRELRKILLTCFYCYSFDVGVDGSEVECEENARVSRLT